MTSSLYFFFLTYRSTQSLFNFLQLILSLKKLIEEIGDERCELISEFEIEQ